MGFLEGRLCIPELRVSKESGKPRNHPPFIFPLFSVAARLWYVLTAGERGNPGRGVGAEGETEAVPIGILGHTMPEHFSYINLYQPGISYPLSPSLSGVACGVSSRYTVPSGSVAFVPWRFE